MTGRTVRVYMADGSPFGIRKVEIYNRTITALSVPRTRLQELRSDNWREVRGPGVYFLVGKPEFEGEIPEAYIGEAQDLLKRLSDHLTDTTKDFWKDTVLFISKDENIHKEYLESRLIDEAYTCKRYKLNQNHQQTPPLSHPDRDAMEEMIPDIRLILGALGHPILEPKIVSAVIKHSAEGSPQAETGGKDILAEEFTFEGRTFSARGRITDEGFVILQDSQADATESPSINPRYTELRQRLRNEGIVKESEDNQRLIFTGDYQANSSSQAASVIAGQNRSGPASWTPLSDDKKTLGDVERESVKTDSPVSPPPVHSPAPDAEADSVNPNTH
jgi:hypothetical protein